MFAIIINPAENLIAWFPTGLPRVTTSTRSPIGIESEKVSFWNVSSFSIKFGKIPNYPALGSNGVEIYPSFVDTTVSPNRFVWLVINQSGLFAVWI